MKKTHDVLLVGREKEWGSYKLEVVIKKEM
jgi:hypothetical protein